MRLTECICSSKNGKVQPSFSIQEVYTAVQGSGANLCFLYNNVAI